MGTRPILGVPGSPPEQGSRGSGASTEPEASQAVPLESQLATLPIASELPAWDLLPADTLLVRRRPAKP